MTDSHKALKSALDGLGVGATQTLIKNMEYLGIGSAVARAQSSLDAMNPLRNMARNSVSDIMGSIAEQNFARMKLVQDIPGVMHKIQAFKPENYMPFSAQMLEKMKLPKLPEFGTGGFYPVKIEIPRPLFPAAFPGDFFKNIVGEGLRRADTILDENLEAVLWAAAHGWFIIRDMAFTDLVTLGELYKVIDVDSLHKMLTEITKDNVVAIEESLIANYPERTPVIKEAFALYREGRYIACIPLLLILSEGIGIEVTKESVFNIHRSKPKVVQFIEVRDVDGSFAGGLMKSLGEPHPLSKPKKGHINRHLILHGNDSSFGTEFGALQAISFLGHLDWMLEILKEAAPKAHRDPGVVKVTEPNN